MSGWYPIRQQEEKKRAEQQADATIEAGGGGGGGEGAVEQIAHRDCCHGTCDGTSIHAGMGRQQGSLSRPWRRRHEVGGPWRDLRAPKPEEQEPQHEGTEKKARNARRRTLKYNCHCHRHSVLAFTSSFRVSFLITMFATVCSQIPVSWSRSPSRRR